MVQNPRGGSRTPLTSTVGTELSHGRGNRNAKRLPTGTPTDGQAPTKFTMEELEYVLSRLKKNKAPGPDEARAEITLLLNYWGQQEFLKIINGAFGNKKYRNRGRRLLLSAYTKVRVLIRTPPTLGLFPCSTPFTKSMPPYCKFD